MPGISEPVLRGQLCDVLEMAFSSRGLLVSLCQACRQTWRKVSPKFTPSCCQRMLRQPQHVCSSSTPARFDCHSGNTEQSGTQPRREPHTPVLLREVLQYMDIKPGQCKAVGRRFDYRGVAWEEDEERCWSRGAGGDEVGGRRGGIDLSQESQVSIVAVGRVQELMHHRFTEGQAGLSYPGVVRPGKVIPGDTAYPGDKEAWSFGPRGASIFPSPCTRGKASELDMAAEAEGLPRCMYQCPREKCTVGSAANWWYGSVPPGGRLNGLGGDIGRVHRHGCGAECTCTASQRAVRHRRGMEDDWNGVGPDCHGVTQEGTGSSSATSPADVETTNKSVCGGIVVSVKMNAITREEGMVSLQPYRTICRNCV
ncbi:hypothetical protein NFI96_009888 [Prochilodus magdalenae]|nr:hypothetical protein NFI96_009888 [Prochilodus magdalenae]